MECNFSINLGAGFFWCLTLLMSGTSAFCSWHARRIFDNWLMERSLRKGQVALLGEYVPLADRIPKPRPQPRPEAVVRMRVKPPEERPKPEEIALTRPGWRTMDDYYYRVAAE